MKSSRRVGISAMILSSIIAIGVIGYMLIEEMTFTQALYMTVITLSTVGFREVKELSSAGMYFTIFIIITGVIALFFLIGSLVELMLEDIFGERMGRRRMNLRIRKLKGHYVICGFGRVGENVCRELWNTTHDLVVVEHDGAKIKHAEDEGFLVVRGDATEVEVLEEAGVMRAKGLVSALHTDADNLFVTLTSHSLNPDLFIVTRSVQPQSIEKLLYAGANRVISPYVMSARRMANLLEKPSVCDFLDIVVHAENIEFRLEEMVVGKDSTYAGQTIAGSRLRADTGALILALREAGREDFNTNPDKDTRLKEGDTLILMGTGDQLARVQKKV